MDNKEIVVLAGKDNGSGGTDANAVHYTADAGKTEAQKAQARANIGAVSIDEIGTVFTLKGSVATVADLPATGNSVGDVYYVESASAGYIWITSTTHPNGYWEELGETIDLSAYQLKPTVVNETGSAVIVTPANNTIYNCGELSSLTISNPPATGAYSIVFTSGSTATVLTTPAGLVMPDDFTVEANARYEINVLDGYALCAGWAVSA